MAPLIPVIGSIFTGLIDLAKEATDDKDKQMALTTQLMEAKMKMLTAILQQQTIPWVDAVVKLAMASDQIIKGLWRPVGSFAMAGFAGYCILNGIPIPAWADPVMAAMGMSPVAWGVSRYMEKRK